MRKLAVPLAIGIVGVAILLALGVWQVQRLAWKQDLLAGIEDRIGADPVALPEQVDPERHAYLPVVATGVAEFGARVLASAKRKGAGYRMIDVFDIGGRKVLLDRGFISVEDHTDAWKPQQVTIVGNLHWPEETDGFTPDPDLDKKLWFARDVPAMAAALGTEPVMIVAREITPMLFTAQPMPVGTEAVPNDHLQYAFTWFLLAAVWAGMTALWLWRITHPRD